MTSAEMATQLTNVNISEVKLLEIYRLIKNRLTSTEDAETFYRQTSWMVVSHRSEENIASGQKEGLRQILGQWAQRLMAREDLSTLRTLLPPIKDDAIQLFNIAQNPKAAATVTEGEHIVPRFEKFIGEATLATVDYREALKGLLTELAAWLESLESTDLDELLGYTLLSKRKVERSDKNGPLSVIAEIKTWFPQVADLYLALRAPIGRQAILDKVNTPNCTPEDLLAAAKVLGKEAEIKAVLKGKSGMDLATAKIQAKVLLREEMRKA